MPIKAKYYISRNRISIYNIIINKHSTPYLNNTILLKQ